MQEARIRAAFSAVIIPVVFLIAAPCSTSTKQRTNVALILADDSGFYDLGRKEMTMRVPVALALTVATASPVLAATDAESFCFEGERD